MKRRNLAVKLARDRVVERVTSWAIGVYYSLTRERTDFDEIWHKCSFRKNIWHVFLFFKSAIIDVEGVETTLKVASPEHKYFVKNISKMTGDTVFV